MLQAHNYTYNSFQCYRQFSANISQTMEDHGLYIGKSCSQSCLPTTLKNHQYRRGRVLSIHLFFLNIHILILKMLYNVVDIKLRLIYSNYDLNINLFHYVFLKLAMRRDP